MERNTRREFVTLAGGGAAASMAGCLGFGDDEETAPIDADGSELDDAVQQQDDAEEIEDVDGLATAAVEPDDEALFEIQMEIQEQVEDGELSEEEAQQQIQEAQQELIEEANAAFLDHVDDEDGITIEDSIDEVGAFLLDGEAEPILGLLEHDEVSALLSTRTFAEALAQQP